jgi:hypothetical protein
MLEQAVHLVHLEQVVLAELAEHLVVLVALVHLVAQEAVGQVVRPVLADFLGHLEHPVVKEVLDQAVLLVQAAQQEVLVVLVKEVFLDHLEHPVVKEVLDLVVLQVQRVLLV